MSVSDAALPRVITEPIGGGPLARAAAGDAPPPFYAARPSSAGEWSERAADVRRRSSPAWLDTLRPAFGASLGGTAAGERLARSAGGAGILVTTGQQPGLFGGPVYTWAKAMSALALADALERATGLPVAPVFWAATDDADFAEATVTRVAIGGEVVTLRQAPTAPDGVPMAAVPLGDDVPAAFETLMQGAGSATFARAWEVARAAYLAPGQTVGGAYVALLRTLLEPLGVAVLDASHPATRAAADPVLREALRRAADVERAVAERDAAIRGAGYDVQVPAVAGLSLVFASDAGRAKARVKVSDAARVAASAAPGSLGPNVLLRPVVERAMLPTVAYVAGPGEIAYFAQVGAVAAALGADVPLPVPRWSCTLLEPHVARILARRGLEPSDLAQPHAAEGRLAREALPADVAVTLAQIRAAVRSGIDRLADADRPGANGRSAPLVPSAAVDGARRSLEVRLDRLERRYAAAAKRTATEAMRDLAVARAALYPEGTRQERSLNFLPFLARYGPALLDAMRQSAAMHASRLAAADERAAAPRPPQPAASR